MIPINLCIIISNTHENNELNLPVGGVANQVLQLLPSYEKIVIGGSPVSQILTTTVSVASTAGSPLLASIQVFRNGILQNEDTTTGGGIDGDFEVTGPNQLTFAADSLQPGGIIIIYVFG